MQPARTALVYGRELGYAATVDRIAKFAGRKPFAVAALAAGLLLLGLWVAFSFLPALAWAMVLAIAVDPLYVDLRQRRPASGRVLLPLAVTGIVALAVLIPLALAINEAAREAADLIAWISAVRATGIPVPDWVNHLPWGSQTIAAWWQDHLATPEHAAQEIAMLQRNALLTHSQLLGTLVLHRAVIFAFTLLTLFFLLRDRDAIIAQLRATGDRLLGPTGERMALQTVRSVRGTIDGIVLVALGEGALMVPVYILLGVPHPLMFGILTAIAATIPFGAAAVFLICAALLLAQGSFAGALVVIALGLLVVAVADHFARPALIGSATRLPFIWVLIGILGGVERFGLLGLFVGPAVMAVLVMMWREFIEAS